MSRVKLRDVAGAAHVSVSVASRALGGYAEVAPGTRERVREAAARLGYRPSLRARSLVSGKDAPLRCAAVGLGLPPTDFGRYFLGPVFAGMMDAAQGEQLEVQLLTSSSDEPPADALRRFIAEDRADGYILFTTLPLRPEDTLPAEEAGVPYVLANRHFGTHPVSCVVYDWEGATNQIVTHLHTLGHRHLALLLPDLPNTTVTGHAQGWEDGRAACGLPAPVAPVLRYPRPTTDDEADLRSPRPTADDEASGYEVARTVLTCGLPGSKQIPTALVGFNDWCALGMLRAATDLGVAIPERLSVVGFDNTLLGYGTTPPMCSFQPQSFQMGQQAARLLAAHLRREVDAPQRVVVPVDFVCRGSCGPAPD